MQILSVNQKLLINKGMQYFGGKSRIAKKLANIIQPVAQKRKCYVEPFVGGASMMCSINADRRIGADLNKSLICMWRALSNGWIPPDNLSEEEYNKIKKLSDDNDPMTAFVGFGCSFAGKWFGGYARDHKNRNYAKNAANSLKNKMQYLKNIEWLHCNYRDLIYPENSVIYCDPPYKGTTKYTGIAEDFNYSDFWQFCRNKTQDGHIVFISEYKAPEDFIECIKIETKLDIRTKNNDPYRIEKLFMYNENINDL
jgi:DNA adenine methylase